MDKDHAAELEAFRNAYDKEHGHWPERKILVDKVVEIFTRNRKAPGRPPKIACKNGNNSLHKPNLKTACAQAVSTSVNADG